MLNSHIHYFNGHFQDYFDKLPEGNYDYMISIHHD